jgi:hypothetical protein
MTPIDPVIMTGLTIFVVIIGAILVIRQTRNENNWRNRNDK